jgi:hypothetical protein
MEPAAMLALGSFAGQDRTTGTFQWQKTFKFRERLNTEIRGDFFNAFNHTQWNSVNTAFYPSSSGNVPFGQVTGAREARIIQLAAKISF